MECHILQWYLPFSLDSQKAFGKHFGFAAQFSGRCKSSGICDKAPKPGKGEGKRKGCHKSDQTLPLCREETGFRKIGCKRPSSRQFQTYTKMLSTLTIRSQKVAPLHNADATGNHLHLFISWKAAVSGLCREWKEWSRISESYGQSWSSSQEKD